VGCRREARKTNDEALRPGAARPTQTGQGREAGRRRMQPAGGRAAHGRRHTKPICALHDGAPTGARRLATAAASIKRPRKPTDNATVEAGVSENVTSV